MPKTLLIVDDSSIIRAAVVKAVEPTRLFARILQAPNGVGGLETLLNEDIDLMISDINMPNMDGYKLLLTLRSMEKYKDLPVILLSSKKETHDKIKGLQGGANDYVTKPFEPGELIARIKNLLTMKELQDELGRKNKEMELANKKLEQLSVTDDLTGLWNRRYLWERLEEEFNKTKRNRQTLSCLMIDADNFKTINDTYGHIFGDSILKEIANILRRQCRAYDLLARFGGEEFIMVLHQTDLEGARRLAQRLLKAVERHSFTTEDQTTLKITVSIGIATYPTHDSEGTSSLVKKADEALYLAKRNGKNRIECAKS